MPATATKPTSSATNGSKRRTQGPRVVRWIESNCVHTQAEWAGKPFRFLDWQKRLVYELFEVGDDGLRRYRWALIGVPKKQGKTELAAALGLYFLIGDGEPSALVACAAASDEQADLVYGAARIMVERSPTLSQVCEAYEKEILVPSLPGSRLRRVSAVAGTNDGQNIQVVICDELHEWTGPKGKQVWNVLTNGTGARRQPMVLQVTTAGFDLEDTICGQQYTYGQKVKNGQVDDPHYYFNWYEAPASADHRDPAVWEAANPSYGVLTHEAFYRDQLTKKTEAVFRRYFLNSWTQTEEIWLPPGAWDACKAPDLELDPALPLHVGIDVALRHDSTAVVAAQLVGEEPEPEQPDLRRTVVRARVWENPYPETDSRHAAWQLNLAEVEEHLRDLRRRFPVAAAEVDDRYMPGPEFSYDPAYFLRSAQALDGDGLCMVEFPQADARMVPASQQAYQLICEGKLAHDGDPVLARHVLNVIADQRPRGWRMSKPKGSRKKIDAAIAMAIAVYRAQAPSPPTSVYESRGLLNF